jgi:hypothetical protein
LLPLTPASGEERNHIPAVPLGDGFKLPLLILDRLLCRGDAEVKSDSFRHAQS